MKDSHVASNNSNDPRLSLIESYLSKSSKKEGKSTQITELKKRGINHYAKQFNTDLQKGLSDNAADKNQQKYGKNQYKKKKTKSFWKILLNALSDQMLIILMVAAVISIIVEYFFSDQKQTFWLQGVSILVAVAVVSLVSSINDYQKQKQFEQLNEIQEKTNNFKVMRNGQKKQIHKSKIVVGDIVLIEGGNQIPADGLVVTTEQAIVDEGSITGQAIEKYKCSIEQVSDEIAQQSPSPIVISGTSMNSGFMKMIVLIVGKQSTAGKLNQQIFDDENQQKTPLELKLDALVNKIGKLGVYSAIIVFVALTVRLVFSDIIPGGWKGQYFGEILKYLILGVSIIVVAIPEGLPLAVTLALAYSVKQMLKQKNLVRKLASCETMGGAHVICTDKTGTLTQNQMSIVEIWNGKLLDHKQFKKQFQSNSNSNNKNNNSILNSLMLNTKAVLDPKPQGSSTQLALLKYCKDIAPSYYEKTASSMDKKILARIPFNSDRKRMSTLIQQNGKKVLLQKGGVEIVIQACDKAQVNGQKQPINKKQIEQSVEKMAKKGHRVIALAYKQVNDESAISQMKSNTQKKGQKVQGQKGSGVLDIQKNGFVLQLLIGIQDLPRQQTKSAIKDCHRGQVVVVMVTGDNKLTARAIADQVGITNPNDNSPGLVRQGKQIQKIANEQDPMKIQAYLKNLKVMARSRPQHKYMLVDCIKRLNNVTAVTGDGTNDAPALMKADVGFSMGVKGTQIAKSASDIIIMDDKFDSIVRALIWGRNIYQSIRKFLQFQLTVNIVACLMSVISSVIIRQSVLTALQMLWVNMIMDSLASLALATQPPNGDQLLDRKPFEKKQPLITKTMFKHIIGQSVFHILVLLGLLFFGPNIIPEYADQYDGMIGNNLSAKYHNGQAEGTVTNGMSYTLSGQDNYVKYYDEYHVYSRHMTFIFTTFVMMQFFNFFNCRRIRDQPNILSHPCSNWLYWIIVVFIFVAQWCIVTFLSKFFKLYNFGGMTIQQWILSVFIGATTLLLSQILRLLPIANPESSQQNTVFEEDLHIKYRQYKKKKEKKNDDDSSSSSDSDQQEKEKQNEKNKKKSKAKSQKHKNEQHSKNKYQDIKT